MISQSLLLGQSAPFINYTVEDGLPSNETYCTFEDRNGFLWIGTDRGACRFDGHNFEVFTTADGLPDNTIFQFYEDYAGRIWFYTFNGKVGYYRDGNFYRLDLKNYNYKYINGVYVDEKDDVYVNFYDENNSWLNFRLEKDTIIDSTLNLDFQYIAQTRKIRDSIFYNFESISQKDLFKLIASSNQRHYVNMFREGKQLHKVKLDSNKVIGIGGPMRSKLQLIDKKGNFLSELILEPENFRINGVGRFGKNYFVLTDLYAWIFKINLDSYQFEVIEKWSFKNYNPSFIFPDEYGGIWINTLNKGIIYKPNGNIVAKTFPAEITSTELALYRKGEGAELISNKDNKVFIKNRNQEWVKPYLRKKMNNISKVKYSEKRKEFIVCSNAVGAIFDMDGNITYKDSVTNRVQTSRDTAQGLHIPKGFQDIDISESGNLIVAHKNALWVQDKVLYQPEAFRLFGFQFGSNDTIWCYGMNGLFAFLESQKEIASFRKDSLLSNRINDLVVDKNNKSRMFLATRGVGLIIKHGNKKNQILKKDGLVSNSISKVVHDGDSTIWVSSNTGLSQVKFFNYDPLKYEVINYGQEDGILAREVKDIQFKDDSIFVLAGNVVYGFSKNYVCKRIKPKVHIRSVYVNNEKIEWNNKSNLQLKYDQNKLAFHCLGLYHPNPKGLKYQYSLDGGNSWSYTDKGNIIFENLATGDYSFIIKVVTPKGVESDYRKLSFVIHPPWWKTWWALIIYFLLIAVVVLAIALIRTRNIRKKEIERARLSHEREQNKRRLVEMELKALRAQMNPHFTFNTMNSVQHFITSNHPEEAIFYISRFSRLMRMILDNSMEEFITLEKELEALKLYLEIESLRFSGKLKYSIEIDEDIDETFERIPPLVIQPFCENSIWHGLMSKKGDKQLKINLKRSGDDILCIIEDNGVGRKKAAELKSVLKTKHKSHGITITQTRLELLNELNSKKINSKIIDLTDEKGNSQGTRVEILIPTN